MADEAGRYTSGDIVVVSAVEAIRRRPGMYVGDTRDGSAQHNIVELLVERSVEGYLDGCRSRVDVGVEGARVWVSSEGRGLRLDADGRGFESEMTQITMKDIALPVVNALSRHVQVDVRAHGRAYRQHFGRGRTRGPAARLGEAKGEGVGLQFELDEEVFELQAWDLDALAARLKTLAGLCPGLGLSLQGRAFDGGGGLASLLRGGLRGTALAAPWVFAGLVGAAEVDVALTWVAGARDARIDGYVNRRRVWHKGISAGVLRGVGAAVANTDRSLAGADPGVLAELLMSGLEAAVHVERECPGSKAACRDAVDDDAVDVVARAVERCLTRAWRADRDAFEDVRDACQATARS